MDEQTSIATNAQAASPEPSSASSPLFRELVETVLLAALVFLAVNATVGRFSLDGPSMQPTLHKGEYVLVGRVDYRVRPPERGDVIVFKLPEGMRIKRIIGLPGETIEVRHGQVYINGQFLPESYVKNAGTYSMGPQTIGADEYFVLGDNRNNSSDSHNYGPVSSSTFDGKAWVIYWPPQDWEVIAHYSYPTFDMQVNTNQAEAAP